LATRKKVYNPFVYFEDAKSIPKSISQKTRNTLIGLHKIEDKRRRTFAHDIKQLNSEYRSDFLKLINPADLNKYLKLKKKLKKQPRGRRLHQLYKLIDKIGIDSVKVTRLRNAYLKSLQRLLALNEVRNPIPPGLFLDEYSPWVTYEAPFTGSFATCSLSQSGGAKNPSGIQYINKTTGEIHSTLDTQLDDDGSLSADIYNALNVWHTPLADGRLECYLVFQFLNSTYSGEVKDEWGLSDIVYNQWAYAVLRVLDSSGLLDSQRSKIFNVIDSIWGEDDFWTSYAAEPFDQHWYHFETAQAMSQGNPVLIEAGIRNVTWFDADNQSIKTSDDIHMRLLKIMVRTRLY
jgi:hypothetical protein